jgi:hypothetical protein
MRHRPRNFWGTPPQREDFYWAAVMVAVAVAVAALRRYPRPRAHQSKPEFFSRVVEWEVVPCCISWAPSPSMQMQPEGREQCKV